MHKLHIIQRKDGTVLAVAVLNPGTPRDVAERLGLSLKAGLGKEDKALVVPYATAVVVTQETLFGQLKSWWTARRLKARAS